MTSTDVTASPLKAWLDKLRLSILLQYFDQRGISDFSGVLKVQEADFETLGLKPLEKKRLFRAIGELREANSTVNENACTPIEDIDHLVVNEQTMTLADLLIQKKWEERALELLNSTLCQSFIGYRTTRRIDISELVKYRLEASKVGHVDRLKRIKALIAKKRRDPDAVDVPTSAEDAACLQDIHSTSIRDVVFTLLSNKIVVLKVPDKSECDLEGRIVRASQSKSVALRKSTPVAAASRGRGPEPAIEKSGDQALSLHGTSMGATGGSAGSGGRRADDSPRSGTQLRDPQWGCSFCRRMNGADMTICHGCKQPQYVDRPAAVRRATPMPQRNSVDRGSSGSMTSSSSHNSMSYGDVDKSSSSYSSTGTEEWSCSYCQRGGNSTASKRCMSCRQPKYEEPVRKSTPFSRRTLGGYGYGGSSGAYSHQGGYEADTRNGSVGIAGDSTAGVSARSASPSVWGAMGRGSGGDSTTTTTATTATRSASAGGVRSATSRSQSAVDDPGSSPRYGLGPRNGRDLFNHDDSTASSVTALKKSEWNCSECGRANIIDVSICMTAVCRGRRPVPRSASNPAGTSQSTGRRPSMDGLGHATDTDSRNGTSLDNSLAASTAARGHKLSPGEASNGAGAGTGAGGGGVRPDYSYRGNMTAKRVFDTSSSVSVIHRPRSGGEITGTITAVADDKVRDRRSVDAIDAADAAIYKSDTTRERGRARNADITATAITAAATGITATRSSGAKPSARAPSPSAAARPGSASSVSSAARSPRPRSDSPSFFKPSLYTFR